MDEKQLLKLLHKNETIREAIRNIVNEKKLEPPIQEEETIDYKKCYEHAMLQHVKDEEEIVMFKAMVAKWKQCFADEERKTEHLTTTNEQLQKRLTDDISQLQQQKQTLITTNEQLQHNIEALQSDNATIQNANKKLDKTIDFYRENFEDELTAYEHFTSLSPTTKKSIASIFKDTSLKGFLACGVQDKNIASFWDYIKTELQEDNNPDIERLIQIHEFLMTRYLIAFPMYTMQQVTIGDNFDPLAHIKHSRSKAASGQVSKVVLKGYINQKTSKIIKQSVVTLG